MHVPEIIEVKDLLNSLQQAGLVESWELPYENILSRRSAALFFLTPSSDIKTDEIWAALAKFDDFAWQPNQETQLSALKYMITFNKEEREKLQTAKTTEILN